MTDLEIKQRLERYKKWRRDRSRKGYIGPGVCYLDFDWLIDELERQLERNDELEREIEQKEIAAIKTGPVNLDLKPEDWLPTGKEMERLLKED